MGGAAYPYIVVFGGEAGRLYLYKDIYDARMGYSYILGCADSDTAMMAGKWSEHV